MHILVTGAAGFIGFHLSRRLCELGHTVVGIDNLNDYYSVALKQDRLKELATFSSFRFVHLDIADAGALQDLFAANDFPVVLHMAAQAGVRYSLENPQAYVQSNMVGFANILERCRQARTGNLIYASSSSVYGMNHKQPFAETDAVDHPVSLYAATKKSNELMAHSYSHLYGLPCTGLRFFTVYGPWGRPDMALYLFTKAILAGEPVPLFNQGHMRRDFTYIDDIVAGVVSLVDKPAAPSTAWDPRIPQPDISSAPYRLFNIGNNKPEDLEYVVLLLEQQLSKTAQKRYLPMQPGDVEATSADVTALHEATGYTPKTSIEEGVQNFVAWYTAYHKS